MRFLADERAKRHTVPSPIPSSLAIFAQESPCARNVAILRASTIVRGRPSRFSFARAFRSPARTRSAIKLRSNSATAPRTVNTILPAGVEVSTPSVRLTSSTLRAWNVSRAQGQMRQSEFGIGSYPHALALLRRDRFKGRGRDFERAGRGRRALRRLLWRRETAFK